MNYTTSRDYEALWKLVQENEIPCLYWDEDTQRAGFTRKAYRAAFTPGLSYCSTREGFIQRCKEEQVEALLPSEWIKIESDKDLPPDGDYGVLVYRKDKIMDICKANYLLGKNYLKEPWYKEDGITHWKPMPKAPEVQS